MNQETKQWLDMADMDLGVAKYLKTFGDYLLP